MIGINEGINTVTWAGHTMSKWMRSKQAVSDPRKKERGGQLACFCIIDITYLLVQLAGLLFSYLYPSKEQANKEEARWLACWVAGCTIYTWPRSLFILYKLNYMTEEYWRRCLLCSTHTQYKDTQAGNNIAAFELITVIIAASSLKRKHHYNYLLLTQPESANRSTE